MPHTSSCKFCYLETDYKKPETPSLMDMYSNRQKCLLLILMIKYFPREESCHPDNGPRPVSGVVR